MTPFAIFAVAAALSITAVELDGAGNETASDIETLISIGSAAASASAPADPKEPSSAIAVDSTSTLGEAQSVKNEVPAVTGSGSMNKNFGGEDAERSRQRTDMKLAAPNEAAEKWMK